ncbi:hypothetical protein Syun_014170 [Stephania yunnanensis]|uniref:Uncharacterized protein n=1 Tax=Stephania yunnanensis TaxID=152371 RepID=A0AAP0JJL4_9MAGN
MVLQKRQLVKNWKVNKEMKYQECISVSLVSSLTISCKATFSASVDEIFLPLTNESDGEKDQMFIRRRLYTMEYDKIMEDLICMGCKLCGIPMSTEGRNVFGQSSVSLYCQKSSSRVHTLCLIYRKFMLYVWDESECIPLVVTNKSAEILFGNITAEQVYRCYRDDKVQSSNRRNSDDGTSTQTKASAGEEASDGTPLAQEENQQLNNIKQGERTDFYKIWVILLKMLLRHESNSPLKFTVNINSELSQENGRFELIGMTMPCI